MCVQVCECVQVCGHTCVCVLASVCVCVCAVFERDRGASKRVINTLKSSLFNDHLSKALIGEFETLNVARIY